VLGGVSLLATAAAAQPAPPEPDVAPAVEEPASPTDEVPPAAAEAAPVEEAAVPPEPAPAPDAGPPQPLFSDNQIYERSGFNHEEPGLAGTDTRHVVTFQHFDAWAYGRNLFFFDVTLPWGNPDHEQEVYGEAYSSLSLSALTGRSIGAGPIKDVALTLGLNVGANSNGAAPLAALPGISLDFDVPGFTVASLDLLGYVDRGRFAGADNGCHAVAFDAALVWQRPWRLGALAGTFEGLAELNTGHGACATQLLVRPQLRLDLGRLVGHPHRLFAGAEYSLWLGKFGIADLDEYVPRTLLVWRL
jgi:nucleoside-specific outer membrane channel protein Tsx